MGNARVLAELGRCADRINVVGVYSGSSINKTAKERLKSYLTHTHIRIDAYSISV